MTASDRQVRDGGERWAPWLVLPLALLGQWPLIANPGYFSHDELQWASFAGSSGPIHWVAWTAIGEFQYRPLTFNLWLWLSRHLFDQPHAFHLLLAAWGAGNAALLCALARRLGVATWPVVVGALVFALGPFAAYVQGWVGTMGDLAWVSCALGVGWVAVAGAGANGGERHRMQGALLQGAAALLLTTLGVLAKEAAVVIPALLALAWWFDGRKRQWAIVTVASGIVVAVYLALRIGVLLSATRVGAQYELSLAHVPLRWTEYQLFGFVPSLFETFNTLLRGLDASMAMAGALWLALLAALWCSQPRLAALFLLGGIASLAPVLPLANSGNHYGYGFAALTAMVVAAAWTRAPAWGRGVIALTALLFVSHGVNVMRMVRHVGQVQAVFSPALAQAVKAHGDMPLRLRVADGADNWIFARLTFNIPSYQGVAIGDRVIVVEGDAPADAVIGADGSITPL